MLLREYCIGIGIEKVTSGVEQSLEPAPYIYEISVYDRGGTANQWEKKLPTRKKMKLDPYLPHTIYENQFQWIHVIKVFVNSATCLLCWE